MFCLDIRGSYSISLVRIYIFDFPSEKYLWMCWVLSEIHAWYGKVIICYFIEWRDGQMNICSTKSLLNFRRNNKWSCVFGWCIPNIAFKIPAIPWRLWLLVSADSVTYFRRDYVPQFADAFAHSPSRRIDWATKKNSLRPGNRVRGEFDQLRRTTNARAEK